MFIRNTFRYICVISIFCFHPFSASAVSDMESYSDIDNLMDMDIEDLVVSIASKKEEKITEAPGIISVITRKDIDRYGAQNLNDLLRRIPGLYVTEADDMRGGTNSIRAQHSSSYDKHVLLLLNGRPMREAFSSGLNNAIFRGFPLEAIEHIEVIRGPGSVLYGSGAFAGVVNIITKTPEKEGFTHKMAAGYGSFNTNRQEYLAEYQKDDYSFLAAAQLADSNGHKIDAMNAYGVRVQDRAGYGNRAVTTQMRYKNFNLSAFEGYAEDDLIDPVNLTSTLTDANFRRRFVDLGYMQPLKGSWKANLNLTYGGSKTWYNSGQVRALSHNTQTDLSTSGNITDNLDLITGITYTDLSGTNKAQRTPFSQTWKSGYFQANFKPVEWLKLTGGYQFNDHGSGSYEPSPRASAIIHFNDRLGLKLLHAEAFRSPSGLETTLFIPGVATGNPSLRPEKIETTDIQLFYQTSRYFAAITAFQSKQEDTISIPFDPDIGMLKFTNAGQLDYQGIEVEGNLNLTQAWSLTGSVSYQENETQAGIKDVKHIPNFMAKTGISYDENGIILGLFNSYFGDDANTATYSNIVAYNGRTGSYNHLTANFSMDVNHVFQLGSSVPPINFSLYGDNLLESDPIYITDMNAEAVDAFPHRAGRSLYARVSIQF